MKLLSIIACIFFVALCYGTGIASGQCTPSLPHPVERCGQLWPGQRICRAEYNIGCTLVNCWCDDGSGFICTPEACRRGP